MSERMIIGDRVAIYKRGKLGLYQADFHFRGQHRRKSLKTSNRKLAVERATIIAVQIIEGTLDSVDEVHQPSTAQTKLASAVIDYRESNRTAGLRPKTIAKYHGTLTDFVEFARSKGATKVSQVSLTLVDSYRSHRSKQKVRGKVIGKTQMYHDASLLKRFLQWCADTRHDRDEPVGQSEVLKADPQA